MANYLFEQMTDAQAAAFTTDDHLFFLTGSPDTLGVTVNPASTLTNESITLTEGTISHTFGANVFYQNDVTFFSGDADTAVQFGSTAANTVVLSATGNHHFYALSGDDDITSSANGSDTIDGGAGDDTITSVSTANATDVYLFGGAGDDDITGGAGNQHIYGYGTNAVAGVTVDGDDTITTGNGSNYVNGNAGNDDITGGTGSDRLFGGADDDSVTGGAGNDSINGNKGDDTLHGGTGNDFVRGGQDNDQTWGDAGDDHLSGDLGNDTVIGGQGYDDLTGGAGNDLFVFAATTTSGGVTTPSDNSIANVASASTATSHDVVDFINDFTHGADKLQLAAATGTLPAAIDLQASGSSFSTIDAAYTYAQGVVSAHHSDVAAIQVGGDTVLFYDSTHTSGTIDSVLLLKSFTASTLTLSDFQ